MGCLDKKCGNGKNGALPNTVQYCENATLRTALPNLHIFTNVFTIRCLKCLSFISVGSASTGRCLNCPKHSAPVNARPGPMVSINIVLLPNLKDPHHFAESEIYSADPDPDLKLAHF